MLLLTLLACTDPDPLAELELQLGRSVSAEEREFIGSQAVYVLIEPEAISAGVTGDWPSEIPLDSLSVPLVGGEIPADHRKGVLHTALYEQLLRAAESWKDSAEMQLRDEFRGELALLVDRRTRDETLTSVAFTAGHAQYGEMRMLAIGPFPTSLPEATEPAWQDQSHFVPTSPRSRTIHDYGRSPMATVEEAGAKLRIDVPDRANVKPYAGQMMASLLAGASNAPLYPSFEEAAKHAEYEVLPSIEMLITQSKQVDEDLLLAVHRKHHDALQVWLKAASKRAADANEPLAATFLAEAELLGAGLPSKASEAFRKTLAPPGGPWRHEPTIYARDRWLARTLDEQEAASIQRVWDAVPETLAAKRKRHAAWTNPALKANIWEGGEFLLSPARSPETLWINDHGGAQVGAARRFAKAIEAGETSLALRADSGLHDRQMWSLEPLLTRTDPLEFAPAYEERLLEAFLAAMAMRRDTQSKDLALPGIGAAHRKRPLLKIGPLLHVEPAPTHFVRQASTYDWIANQASKEGLSVGGAASMSELYFNLSLVSMQDLGIPIEKETTPSPWLTEWPQASWATEDAALYVPMGIDERDNHVAIAILGVTTTTIEVTYASPPKVTPIDGAAYDVEFVPTRYTLLVPVVTELATKEPLSTEELRVLSRKHPWRAQLEEELRTR